MTKAVLALCLAAAALSGCADLSGRCALYDQREEKLSNVMGDTWQFYAVWPWEDMAIRVREYVNDYAQDYCQKSDKSAQPLDAVSQKRDGKPGSEAVIVSAVFQRFPIRTLVSLKTRIRIRTRSNASL